MMLCMQVIVSAAVVYLHAVTPKCLAFVQMPCPTPSQEHCMGRPLEHISPICRRTVSARRRRLWEINVTSKKAGSTSPGSVDSSAEAKTALSRAREALFQPSFRKLLGPMAVSGALLGPNLDNYHSAFGVLSYKNPIELELGGHILVTTDWWVPPLFAVAGAGIGGLYILLDAALETPVHRRSPEWRDVFLGISLFSFQYYVSGLLTASGCPRWLLTGSLLVITERMFRLFDSTAAGFWVSLATAVSGPLIEVFLVNVTDLYVYNDADLFGVDSWIPLVYFCGGPAVGNLARAVYTRFGVGEEGGTT